MFSKFDHPLLFVLALVMLVTAGQKLVAYGAGKAGMPTVHKFFAGG